MQIILISLRELEALEKYDASLETLVCFQPIYNSYQQL